MCRPLLQLGHAQAIGRSNQEPSQPDWSQAWDDTPTWEDNRHDLWTEQKQTHRKKQKKKKKKKKQKKASHAGPLRSTPPTPLHIPEILPPTERHPSPNRQTTPTPVDGSPSPAYSPQVSPTIVVLCTFHRIVVDMRTTDSTAVLQATNSVHYRIYLFLSDLLRGHMAPVLGLRHRIVQNGARHAQR